MTIDDFLKLAGGGSAVVVCLVIAIKFLFAEKNKVEAKLDAEREKRISTIEQQSKRCADDRVVLHNEISRLNQQLDSMREQMTSLMHGMLKSKGHGMCEAPMHGWWQRGMTPCGLLHAAPVSPQGVSCTLMLQRLF